MAKKSGRKTASAATMDSLRAFIRAKGHAFLKDPNITSIGIGRKNGDGPISLQFTVAAKVPNAAIEGLGSTPIPPTIMVDGTAFPTDVLERSYAPGYRLVAPETLGERRERMDPLRPGISVSHPAGTAGTIGLIVYDRETAAPCILSNWHVLHGAGGMIGDATVQPGPFDDNNVAGNFCGNLLRSHLGAAGDCALSRIRTREHDRDIFGLDTAPSQMVRVELDDRLVKSGRTTGTTYGIVRRVDVLSEINYGPGAGPVAIGGFEIGIDPDRLPDNGEISMGGDSGSAWLVAENGKATGMFAGLHFAGEAGANPDEHALACYPLSVQKKLDFLLEPPAETRIPGDDLDQSVARSGYDPDFLNIHAPPPQLTLSQKRDAVNFGRAQMIPYTHFSVCLSAKRRLARFVAWNIDGARKVVVGRTGFRLDPRIPADAQLGDELYANNALDRGHIARRADLTWGTVAEARQANSDSFFFTNIAPQHEGFNQSSRMGLWGRLENLVLEQAEAQNLKISVIGGPVFANDDPEYRTALLPRQFWKLIAYAGTDGALRAACFLLSQSDLLTDLEVLDFDPLRIFQISVTELSSRTDLDFSAYVAADIISNSDLSLAPESAARPADTGVTAHEITSESDLVL